jgi:hypothetical protein
MPCVREFDRGRTQNWQPFYVAAQATMNPPVYPKEKQSNHSDSLRLYAYLPDWRWEVDEESNANPA